MQILLKVVRSVLLRHRALKYRFCQRRFRWKVHIESWLNGVPISIPKSCALNVPVCCNGAGTVVVGEGVSLGYKKAPLLGDGTILLQARTRDSSIHIGTDTAISNNVAIVSCSSVVIGDGCQIGDQVAIYDCDFHEIDPESRNASVGEVRPVGIGRNVWLGSRVMILKGVQIGDHSVVAAGSIVTKSIPARCIAAGTPAKVIRDV